MLGVGFITDKQVLKGYSVHELWEHSLTENISHVLAGLRRCGALRGVNVRCYLSHATNRIGNARASYDPLSGRGIADGLYYALETVAGLWDEKLEQKVAGRLEKQYEVYRKERLRLYAVGAERFGTDFWRRRL